MMMMMMIMMMVVVVVVVVSDKVDAHQGSIHSHPRDARPWRHQAHPQVYIIYIAVVGGGDGSVVDEVDIRQGNIYYHQ